MFGNITDLSKKISETHDAVLRTKFKVESLDTHFSKHENEYVKHTENNDSTFKILSDKIDHLSCPQSETIMALAAHNKEQNGHLRHLSEKVSESAKQIDSMVTRGVTIKNLKDSRRSDWNFIIAIIICLCTGIGVCYTIMSNSKKDTVSAVEKKLDKINEIVHKNSDILEYNNGKKSDNLF